jgi:hypothetical protein
MVKVTAARVASTAKLPTEPVVACAEPEKSLDAEATRPRNRSNKQFLG